MGPGDITGARKRGSHRRDPPYSGHGGGRRGAVLLRNEAAWTPSAARTQSRNLRRHRACLHGRLGYRVGWRDLREVDLQQPDVRQLWTDYRYRRERFGRCLPAGGRGQAVLSSCV